MKFFLLLLLNTFMLWVSAIEENSLTRTRRSIGGRIVGGEPVLAGEFKFVAAINVQTSSGRYFCGGTLISNEWVLTAGQCVDGAVLFTIRLGSLVLDGEDATRLTLATSEYVLHPDYNPQTLAHDVGLIQFRSPIEFTDYIRPIQHMAKDFLTDFSTVAAVGWGQVSDEDGELSNHLNKVYVSSMSNLQCQIIYGSQVTDDMVCINGNYNEGACIGDTGSPLVQTVSRGQQLHVGISTFISGNGCQSTDPSGYTRTYSYVEWIGNITNVY